MPHIPLKLLFFISALFVAFLPMPADEDDDLLAEIDALLNPELDPLEESAKKNEAYFFSEVYGGFGHTDNVFLEPAPIAASYARVSADVFATLETPRYGSFQAFLIYDESIFEDVDLNGARYDVPNELSAYADLTWSYSISKYELFVGAGYSYAEYFFEPISVALANSAFLKERRPIATFGLSTLLRKNLETSLRFGYETPRYDGTADDFDVQRFESITSWSPSEKHTLRLRLGYSLENYLDANERRPTVVSIPGTSLEIDRYLGEIRWDYMWTAKRDHRLRIPVRFEIRDDSGGSYYDSWRIGFYPELRWYWTSVEFRLGGSVDYIEYAERTVSLVDLESRWQVRTRVNIEVSRRLGRLKLWAKANWAELDSNVSTINYKNKSIESGISVEF